MIPLRSAAIEDVEMGIRAKYPAMYLQTHEEGRMMAELKEMCDGIGYKLFIWSIASGLRLRQEDPSNGTQYTSVDDTMDDPVAILKHIATDAPKNAVYVMADFHEFLQGDLVVRRFFREVADSLRTTHKSMLVMSPVLHIPDTLEKTITVIDVGVPTRSQLEDRLNKLISKLKSGKKGAQMVDADSDVQAAIVDAGVGLTRREFDQCLGRALVRNKRIDAEAVPMIAHEKAQIVKKSGLMEFLETTLGFDDVGGNDLLKKYIIRRKRAFTPAAKKFGLDTPKGTLYVGPPGIGKSLIAKSTANALGVPLIRLDMGALFGGLVGESEANARKAIQTAEACAPCVLWLDEIEKGMAGLGSSNHSDGGTTARVFSTFLTWMNDKTAPVYVFATANDVSALPPELLRKGRFDEIWAADFPVEQEREQILSIHISKRKRDPSSFDLSKLSEATEGFSGAELEALVADALYSAFDEDRDLQDGDLFEAAEATVPLSQTMKERIEWLRNWAKTRARAASSFHFKGPSTGAGKTPIPTGGDHVEQIADDMDLFED